MMFVPRSTSPAHMEPCPICTGSTTLLFFIRGIPIRRCTSCGHGFADYRADGRHVADIYGDDYFIGGGPGYRNYLSEAELLRQQGRCYGALLDRFAPQGLVLDVGSAAGFLGAGMRDTGWGVTGLEPNRRMASYAANSLGLSMRTGELETLDLVAAYDVVSMIQVVAHFHNPRRAFAAAARATRPHGHWLIEGWAADSGVARLLGRKWHVYNPPSVLNYFTRKSLDLLAAEFGFVRIASGRPRKRITASHAAALFEFLGSRSMLLRVAAKLADRLPPSFELSYPGDDIFWAIYEKGAAAPRTQEVPMTLGRRDIVRPFERPSVVDG
jgi:SAM-dependent methyltransferase